MKEHSTKESARVLQKSQDHKILGKTEKVSQIKNYK